MLKQFILKYLKFLLGHWVVFHIYRKELKNDLINKNNHAKNNVLVKKFSKEQYKLSLLKNNITACNMILLWGDEYIIKRNYIKLAKGEGKVTDVETAYEFRGHGYAGELLSYCELFAKRKGLKTLYARIWHSNNSSIRAFQKSGWERYGIKIKLELFHLLPIKFFLKI